MKYLSTLAAVLVGLAFADTAMAHPSHACKGRPYRVSAETIQAHGVSCGKAQDELYRVDDDLIWGCQPVSGWPTSRDDYGPDWCGHASKLWYDDPERFTPGYVATIGPFSAAQQNRYPYPHASLFTCSYRVLPHVPSEYTALVRARYRCHDGRRWILAVGTTYEPQ